MYVIFEFVAALYASIYSIEAVKVAGYFAISTEEQLIAREANFKIVFSVVFPNTKLEGPKYKIS